MESVMPRQVGEPVPREPRCCILEDGMVGVRVERVRGSAPGMIDAELIDISRSGVKLRVASCPALGEEVVLRLEVPSADLDLALSAKVQWTRAVADETWRIGCALASELPEHILSRLAVNGYIQRRQDERHATDIGGKARWELDRHPFPVRIVNFSAGGFCIACPREERERAGERLLLEFDGEEAGSAFVVGRSVWLLDVGDSHRIGCTFVNREGHRLLRRMLSGHEDPAQRDQ